MKKETHNDETQLDLFSSLTELDKPKEPATSAEHKGNYMEAAGEPLDTNALAKADISENTAKNNATSDAAAADQYETKDKRAYLIEAMNNGFYFYANDVDEAKKPRYVKGIQEHGYKSATNKTELIEPLFEPDSKGLLSYNVGINLEASGLICLDFDNHGSSTAGSNLLYELANKFSGLADTVTERTPQGYHLYYKDDLTEQEREIIGANHSIKNLAGLEIKRSNANVWPSKDYSQLGTKTLAKDEVGTLPKAFHKYLNELLTGKRKAVVNTKPSEVNTEAEAFKKRYDEYKKEADEELDATFYDTRNLALISYTGKLAYLGLDEGQRREIIESYVEIHDTTGKEPVDVNYFAKYPDMKDERNGKNKPRRTIYDAFKEDLAAKKAAAKIDNQETDNAEVNAARKRVKEWLQAHENAKLTPDTLAKIMLKCFHVIQYNDGEGERVAMYVSDRKNSKYGLYTQNYSYISSLINLVYGAFSLKQIGEVLTKMEWHTKGITKKYESKNRVPVGNGIYNVDTKQLEPYTPDLVFTTKIETNYNAIYKDEAKAPNINGWKFEEWLSGVCKDEAGQVDLEIYTLLWQVIADAANGNYSHHKAMMLYSSHGGSGKGSFQDLIKNLVGGANYTTARLDQLNQRFTMARLIDKSVCIGDDNTGGYYGDIQNLKSIITSDDITVEPKGVNGYAANFNMLVIQSMNELPTFKDKAGIKRRFMFIPFKQHYSIDEGAKVPERREIKNNYLKRKDVLEYVLYKALTYYYDFEEYINPAACQKLMSEVILDSDNVRAFIVELFLQWKLPIISTAALYEAYKYYCRLNGYVAAARNSFTRRAHNVLKGDDIPQNYEVLQTKINLKDHEKIEKVTENNNYLYGTKEMNRAQHNTQCFKLIKNK